MALLANSVPSKIVSHVGIRLLEDLLRGYPERDFQIRLWDGTVLDASQLPRFTLILNNPAALCALLRSASELDLGEAYICGDFDIEGDIEAAVRFAEHLLSRQDRPGLVLPFAGAVSWISGARGLRPQSRAAVIGPLHSKERDRQALNYHYDLPTDFYSLFLDREMVYSCAYFATPAEDLDSAQVRKLDYICRKLRLLPGERFLDIGCGWGGLIIYAAEHYGVEAVGITPNARQAEVARQRIEDKGLSDKCRVKVCDYRDHEPSQPYDKIASIGMFEHVGESLLLEYFARAWEVLPPGGVFLNHGIAYSATYHRVGPSFTDRYVFPDSELVPISSTLRAAELAAFEVRDVESLREHYALTLRHWVRRLEANAEAARRITDDVTYRIWRLYMAGAAHGFSTGRLNIYQALLTKSAAGNSGLPLSRSDWYAPRGSGG